MQLSSDTFRGLPCLPALFAIATVFGSLQAHACSCRGPELSGLVKSSKSIIVIEVLGEEESSYAETIGEPEISRIRDMRLKCPDGGQAVRPTITYDETAENASRAETNRYFSELVSCRDLERLEARKIIKYRILRVLKGPTVPIVISTVGGRGEDSCMRRVPTGGRYVVFARSNTVHLRGCSGHRRVEDSESAFVEEVAEIVEKHKPL